VPNPVALAEVDICNMALSHLGIGQQIQSINPPDASEQAKACAFWYPKARNFVLRDAPWNFAYTYTTLVSDGTLMAQYPYAYPGWTYAYQYPGDCLMGIAVSTYGGIRWGPAFWAAWWFPYPTNAIPIPKIPWKIAQSMAVPGQLIILTDITSPAYFFYIQCVTNTAQFDVEFSDALSLYLAWKIAGPLRANVQKAQAAQAAYAMARATRTSSGRPHQ